MTTPPVLTPEAVAELQRGLGELVVRVLAHDLGAGVTRLEAKVEALASELRQARTAPATTPRAVAPDA